MANPPPPPTPTTTPLNLIILSDNFSQGPHPKHTVEKFVTLLKITMSFLDLLRVIINHILFPKTQPPMSTKSMLQLFLDRVMEAASYPLHRPHVVSKFSQFVNIYQRLKSEN